VTAGCKLDHDSNFLIYIDLMVWARKEHSGCCSTDRTVSHLLLEKLPVQLPEVKLPREATLGRTIPTARVTMGEINGA
jgi:hypothetical protein